MDEADIHLRPLHTSILDIFKVIEPLVCCLKAIWLHPNTVTPAKLAPDLGRQGHLWSKNDAITSWWGWYPPQTASYIHIRHIQSVWAIGMLSQGHLFAPSYRCTGQIGPGSGKSGSLGGWKWCQNILVEAEIHLRLLHTSILDIYKVFEQLVCRLKEIWLHPYRLVWAIDL
jgi:hypothetical protein